MIRTLLKNKATVNAITKTDVTPLHLTVKNGDTKVIKILLDYEVDKNIINNQNGTPFDIAKRENHNKTVLELLTIKTKTEKIKQTSNNIVPQKDFSASPLPLYATMSLYDQNYSLVKKSNR